MRTELAYHQILPEAMALSSEQLTAIRLDIPVAIITAGGVLPKLTVAQELATNRRSSTQPCSNGSRVETYEQPRRAVIFLRWNAGDADELAPSLYAGRATTAANRKPSHETPVTPAPPAATVGATDATHPTPVQIPSGLSGSDPFIPA